MYVCNICSGSRDGAVVEHLSPMHAGLPPMWPGTRRQIWVEFVVGSRPCSERFFSGYSGFPLSSKTNISKFQLTLKSPDRDEPIEYVFIYLFIYLRIYTIFCTNQGILFSTLPSRLRNFWVLLAPQPMLQNIT